MSRQQSASKRPLDEGRVSQIAKSSQKRARTGTKARAEVSTVEIMGFQEDCSGKVPPVVNCAVDN
jgi:hypothetical protein